MDQVSGPHGVRRRLLEAAITGTAPEAGGATLLVDATRRGGLAC